MDNFLLQYNDIEVVVKPEYKNGRLGFEIIYDNDDMIKNGITKEEIMKEINDIIKEP